MPSTHVLERFSHFRIVVGLTYPLPNTSHSQTARRFLFDQDWRLCKDPSRRLEQWQPECSTRALPSSAFLR
jgi:hypothetical protein